MTWKGVDSFPSVKINVGKNLKDYVNLLLGGCFTFEDVLSTSVLDYAKMCLWKVGGLAAHTGVFLVQSNTPSTLMPVQLQLVGQVKLLRIPPRFLENC